MVDHNSIHHVLNPLHVYCRLIGLGLNPKAARKVADIYEVTIFKAIRWVLNDLKREAN